MIRPTLSEVLSGSPYRGYLYSYPHKTAYRRLDPAPHLADVWAQEDRSALFLYVHVPFCEMRCGFCNLFTTPRPHADRVEAWLSALARHVAVAAQWLDQPRFVRLAIGGGTPTFLTAAQLERLLGLLRDGLGVDPHDVPASVEASPETGDAERLAVLAAHGVDRVSIGVQSFDDDEARRVGRPQDSERVEATLQTLRDLRVRRINLDLMYGIPGQTTQTFAASLDRALAWNAEEIYLYPLYVRPRTGLGPQAGRWTDLRLELYRFGRDHLRAAGYAQASMRRFVRGNPDPEHALPYRCQEDGMVGLGVGARSYTQRLHYASDYAVGRGAVRRIVEDYCAAADSAFARADRGVWLDEEERCRRFAILSLLEARPGLEGAAYRARFGRSVTRDLPELEDLVTAGAAVEIDGTWRLTDLGIERSDAIGPWLQSARIEGLMQDYVLR